MFGNDISKPRSNIKLHIHAKCKCSPNLNIVYYRIVFFTMPTWQLGHRCRLLETWWGNVFLLHIHWISPIMPKLISKILYKYNSKLFKYNWIWLRKSKFIKCADKLMNSFTTSNNLTKFYYKCMSYLKERCFIFVMCGLNPPPPMCTYVIMFHPFLCKHNVQSLINAFWFSLLHKTTFIPHGWTCIETLYKSKSPKWGWLIQ